MRKVQISIILGLLLMLVVAITSSCATKPVADADADQLVEAMQHLPDVQPYLAKTQFTPIVKHENLTKIKNADSRSLKSVQYSEREMLNTAAHASMFRWFRDHSNEENIPVLNIHARIFNMDHSVVVKKGRMQPKAKTKLEVFLTDENGTRIYESFFITEALGEHEELFLNQRETQELYGYTIYKTLVDAFEMAFAHISHSLNLQPTNLDFDDLQIETEQQQVLSNSQY